MLYLPHRVLIACRYTALTACFGGTDNAESRLTTHGRCLLLHVQRVKGLLRVTYHVTVRCALCCTRALCYPV